MGRYVNIPGITSNVVRVVCQDDLQVTEDLQAVDKKKVKAPRKRQEKIVKGDIEEDIRVESNPLFDYEYKPKAHQSYQSKLHRMSAAKKHHRLERKLQPLQDVGYPGRIRSRPL